jgi:LysM repeat protein
MTDTTERKAEDQRADALPETRKSNAKARGLLGRSMLGTMPIMLAGSLALSLGMAAPAEADAPKKPLKSKSGPTLAKGKPAAAPVVAPAAVTPSSAPQQYRVASGDTISSIAGRFGLSTASVLAQNGLGWRSLIFPGQVLTLGSGASVAAPAAATPAAAVPSAAAGSHTVVPGETVSRIAQKYGVSTSSMLAANRLGTSSVIYPGQSLVVPGRTAPAAIVSTPLPARAAVASVGGSHTIQSGDTLSSIAKRHGLTVQDLLNANGLNWSSIIYAGRALTIPGASAATPAAPPAAAPAATNGVVPLTAEMRNHAATIISVGRSMGVSDYGIVIALATAAQESTLRNLDWGDRDSLGLFQQRPTQGWGPRERILDTAASTRAFFGGPGNPNRGLTRGLLDIRGWQTMTVSQAAQAVQISGHPAAYAKWEASAWAWLDQLG